ncbi:DNA-methyltransferase [Listeria booriae]|uniref:DNA-methyltransferase n=1 Tax=Listeria booriae TaxID=1552123 RepID=UPI001C9D540B|nr:site-specific DNA-methyltransferase [Listeria booriae]
MVKTIEDVINKIWHEDCLEGMERIPDASVDFILCDLPYGITNHDWDTIIPFDLLWKAYERIIKPDGAIALTANQSFTHKVISSNPDLFRYKWIWEKNRIGNFINAKQRPMSAFEEILMFSKAGTGVNSKVPMRYYPQGLVRKKSPSDIRKEGSQFGEIRSKKSIEDMEFFTNYPKDIIRVPYELDNTHPTQKPVALFKYLIETYTLPGQVVLDNCMGSGTTAIACMDSQRQFIGFEKDFRFWRMANQRIERNTTQLRLF